MASKPCIFDLTLMPYEKVLLLDPDMVLTRLIDEIFQDPSTEPFRINHVTKVSANLG